MGAPSPKLSTGMCRSTCSCRMTSFTSWTPPGLAQGSIVISVLSVLLDDQVLLLPLLTVILRLISLAMVGMM